jgi:outer membrane protein assembly factor BamD (BamD/ComL family)
MSKHRMWLGARDTLCREVGLLFGLVLTIAASCCHRVQAETWRLKGGEKLETLTDNPQEPYQQALAELKKLVQEGDVSEVKDAIQQIKAEFPDRVGPDLELFAVGETRYWQDHYGKALVKYEKLLKDYPGSEYAGLALQREFDMAQEYLQGRKKTILGFIKISGFAEGVEIMEKISDRAGLNEPNGVGLRAAIAVAEQYEAREKYLEAYLKWSEIASYWETGPVGKRALYRMAEDNLAAYNKPPLKKRPNYDASKLTTAKTYYQKFLLLYPEEAKLNEVPQKIQQIDEQMAFKQYTIGRYYRRTGEPRAATLYFDMVVHNWPQTEAAKLAQEALDEVQADAK